MALLRVILKIVGTLFRTGHIHCELQTCNICNDFPSLEKNYLFDCLLKLNHDFISAAQPSASCTHQALDKEITDQNIVYIRTECRLCQCRKGELICDPKPGRCDEHLATPCVMSKGELASGERHFDGCNNCVCRNGKTDVKARESKPQGENINIK